MYNSEFLTLSNSLDLFIKEVQIKKLTLKVTNEWSVKDLLCHIVFWHETYAANYKSQVEHTVYKLPEKMSTINERGVKSLRRIARKELLIRLVEANKSLHRSIVIHGIKSMTYSKGGRTYNTPEFLTMISRHITTHAKQLGKVH